MFFIVLNNHYNLHAQGDPQLQWVFNAVNASVIGGSTDGRSIAVDAAGNRYVTGYFIRTADFDPSVATANLTSIGGTQDPFIAKYDANGNYLWAKNKSKSIEGNFFISKIYNEHKDIAEEILVKSYIYNKDHLTDLKKFISDKMPSIKIPLDRLFIGNYINEKDLLKRPMAKFTKDIFNEIQRLKFDIDKELKI